MSDARSGRLAAEVSRLKKELERLAGAHRRTPLAGGELRALLAALHAELLVIDGEGRLVERIGEALPLLERRPAGPGGRVRLADLAGRVAPRLEAAARRARESGHAVSLEVSLAPAGEERTYRVHAVPAAAGGALLLLADETERAQAEAARREIDARFRLAFENAPIGMALVGLDERFLQVNEALTRILGYSKEELLGMRVADVTHPEDVEAEAERKVELGEGGTQSFRMVKRYIHASGRTLRGRLSVSAVRDEQGEPLYFIGQLEDITERERLQQRLFQAEKMESLGRLAAGVAHDFNNLLTVILGGCELLEEELARRGLEAEELTAIRHAGERARDLTSQLLAVARRQLVAPRPIDPNEVIRQAERLLRRVLGEDIRLEIDLAEPLWAVKADPAQLQQVILNLAVNARDAMPEGGRLGLATENVRVPDAGGGPLEVEPGEYVRLTVTDSGPGLSPDVRRHLFEPFFTTKPLGEGTGLGLATVYGIVRQSGGQVLVDTRQGRGTTFLIYLPRTYEAPQPATGSDLLLPARAGKETVLLVEDDAAVRDLARRALSSAGYTVLAADSREVALHLARDREVDLLVTDVVLPGGAGTDLAERLRERRPGLPVLFVSGYAGGAPRGARAMPAEPFLAKPFTPSALLVKVREVLGGAR